MVVKMERTLGRVISEVRQLRCGEALRGERRHMFAEDLARRAVAKASARRGP